MFSVGLFYDFRAGYGQRLPHLVKRGPVVAFALAAAVEGVEDVPTAFPPVTPQLV